MCDAYITLLKHKIQYILKKSTVELLYSMQSENFTTYPLNNCISSLFGDA